MPDNDPIEITPVEVPLTQQETQAEPATLYWYQNRNTVIALLAGVLLVLVVIFLLPRFIAPVSDIPVEEQVTEQRVQSGPVESPWQEAQLAKARREAQDVLNGLLEKQQYLESKSVKQWAEQEFNAALENARLGDVAYRKREFSEAISRYQTVHKQLTVLEESIPDRLRTALQQGGQALLDGNQLLANEKFQRALLFDPANSDATKGLARTATLMEVNELVKKAEHAVQQGDFQLAVDIFNQALALDDESPSALQGLALASQQLAQQQFQIAMSDGYQALDSGEFGKAISAFSAALAINRNDEAANNALQQARNRQSQSWLNRTLQQAASHEQQELWAEAATGYESILNRDSSIIDARIGKIRSEARLNLDQQLQKLLDQPERLSSSAVNNQAIEILADARGIAHPGARLKQQIAELQKLISLTAKPVAVELASDNKTEVELYRVEKLGRFSSRVLQLKPGRYVAVGSRKGYRSVRVEFDVAAAQSVTPIEIICRERL